MDRARVTTCADGSPLWPLISKTGLVSMLTKDRQGVPKLTPVNLSLRDGNIFVRCWAVIEVDLVGSEVIRARRRNKCDRKQYGSARVKLTYTLSVDTQKQKSFMTLLTILLLCCCLTRRPPKQGLARGAKRRCSSRVFR
jgi:hypothetical protein